ncbi:methicillin resistance protein [Campylobacter blaseri]|nr:methicillin resistance protein [Campylobacter blaseri]
MKIKNNLKRDENNMTNKEKYREFCKKEKDIPIFSKDWWLDAVCGEDDWDVALVEKNNNIVASFPYRITYKYIFKLIHMPTLTQQIGVHIKYPENQSYYKRISWENQLISELIDKLPKFDYFCQNIHSNNSNWLPFYWKGFNQTTRYTYRLYNIKDIEQIFNNFSHSRRKDIKKNQNKINVKFDLDFNQFYELQKKMYKNVSFSKELFSKIYHSVYKNESGRAIYAIDDEKNIHSALFIMWDSCCAYYILTCINPNFRNSGADSLLIYESIKYVSQFVDVFDFFGSMMEKVEPVRRSFGAVQVPYFTITKTNSKILKIRELIKEIVK